MRPARVTPVLATASPPAPAGTICLLGACCGLCKRRRREAAVEAEARLLAAAAEVAARRRGTGRPRDPGRIRRRSGTGAAGTGTG